MNIPQHGSLLNLICFSNDSICCSDALSEGTDIKYMPCDCNEIIAEGGCFNEKWRFENKQLFFCIYGVVNSYLQNYNWLYHFTILQHEF